MLPEMGVKGSMPVILRSWVSPLFGKREGGMRSEVLFKVSQNSGKKTRGSDKMQQFSYFWVEMGSTTSSYLLIVVVLVNG